MHNEKERLCRIFNCDKMHKNQCCNFCNYRMKCKNRCLNKHRICGQLMETDIDDKTNN